MYSLFHFRIIMKWPYISVKEIKLYPFLAVSDWNFCFFFFWGVSIIMNSRCWKLQESSRNFHSYVKCKPCISHLLKSFWCILLYFSKPCAVLFRFLWKLETIKDLEKFPYSEYLWHESRVISERSWVTPSFLCIQGCQPHFFVAEPWCLTLIQTAGWLCGHSRDSAI